MCGIGSRLAAGAGSGVRCAVSRRRSGGFLDREVEDFIAVEVAPVAERGPARGARAEGGEGGLEFTSQIQLDRSG